MANWRNIIPFIRRWEGPEPSHDPRDSAARFPVPDGSGNHTHKGVTWRVFVSLAARVGYSATPKLFYEMPDRVWEGIYRLGYWNAVRGDELRTQGLADVLVDMAWGAGPRTAVKTLQRALGDVGQAVPVDGKFGPRTLAAANGANQAALLQRVIDRKRAYYMSLTSAKDFARGWGRRLDELAEMAKKELAPAVASASSH